MSLNILNDFKKQKCYQNQPKFNGVYSRNNSNTVQKKLKNSQETKISKIYRIQPYDSIMGGYFCIEFIDFMLKGKSLLDYTNLFYPNEYEMNEQIILKYSQ